MTDANNTAKRTVRAFYDGYNDKDLDATFDAYISKNLKNHVMGGAYDRAAWLATDRGLFPAFADFTMTVLDQIAEGDKVATRYRLGGTHTGEFAGIPATGNVAFLTGTSVDRVEDGQIVEHWGDLDFSGFLQQLTVAPAANDTLRTLAEEYFRLANAHDLDGLIALHAPGYLSHDPQGDTGIDEYRELIRGFFAAFPDSTLTPVNVVAAGDRLVMHFETTATHSGDFMGLPATGKPVHFTEIRVRRIQDGKFAEHWGLLDQATFLSQLQ